MTPVVTFVRARPARRRLSAVLLTLAMTIASLATGSAAAASPSQLQALVGPYQVLVFSKTAGFRHDSIPAGITAIQQLGAANGFTVTATEDPTQFTDANLAQFDVVVFLSTTSDVLDDAQQTAFEHYIEAVERITGVAFVPDLGEPNQRMAKNLRAAGFNP